MLSVVQQAIRDHDCNQRESGDEETTKEREGEGERGKSAARFNEIWTMADGVMTRNWSGERREECTLTRMNVRVFLHIALLVESLATVLAGVGSRVGVNQEVS